MVPKIQIEDQLAKGDEVSALLGCGSSAKLLQHAQQVRIVPPFDELAVGNAENDHPAHRHMLARGCHPLEFALVRPTTCLASRHLVCFGNLILNRDLHVGNCFVAYHLELFCPFRPVDVVWWCMADVIAGHIPLALDVFKYFVGDRLILL